MKIRMRVLASEEIRSLDCIMLSKLGSVYSCIGNGFHPNCGSKEQGYPEMYSVVNWMIENRVNRGCSAVNQWLAQQLRECYDIGLDFDLALETIFSGIDISSRTQEVCNHIWSSMEDIVYNSIRVLELAESIDWYLNQNFLRVRSGGKFNSKGTDSIYFRISSKDYDWRSIIEDFLWDTFKSIKDMPELIWVGHDAETNPPEIVLFEGTPEELFSKYDTKIFASKKFN